ncbi:hypothetical protein [Sulfitobacter sp. 20_GPM-1509m]|uniref:hypothetical protein n=1 Tax=Sulfitobacter sp. 20_GPM-1509m TaxID=1380367 RepID=UPI00055C97A4|nr:hypothetical protein [Sulfitobacter sp. 20_GPM-1509m]
MINRPTQSAPNYTNACIVMFGVNLSWVFLVLWALWGLLAVAALGWTLNRWMTLLEARKARACLPFTPQR